MQASEDIFIHTCKITYIHTTYLHTCSGHAGFGGHLRLRIEQIYESVHQESSRSKRVCPQEIFVALEQEE
jgi:hypothetical protein